MLKLLMWLVGYVSFTARGGFTERFLNLCKIHNINLRNVQDNVSEIKAVALKTEFEKIDIPAQNSGMTIADVKEKGLPFLIKKYKYRAGVLAGVVFAGVFIWFMSGFIWDVEIENDTGFMPEGFETAVYDEGVKVGARKSKIDILTVQENLKDKFADISWVSLNIFGSKAQIEYTPIKKNEPLDDAVTPTNIVASKKGKIVLVEGYRGQNEVKEGDYVEKGDLLISGINVNADLTETLVHAQGKVFALTNTNKVFKQKIKNEVYLTSDNKRKFTLKLFGISIPLSVKSDDEYFNESVIYLKGNNTELPVGISRKDSLNFENATIELTEEQAELLLLKRCITYKRNHFLNVEKEKNEYEISNKLSEIELKFSISCVENIAEERRVFIEEN